MTMPAPDKQAAFHVREGMLEGWIIELLAAQAAEVEQFELDDGYMVRVPMPEMDTGGQPVDLAQMLDEARRQGKEWVFIESSTKPSNLWLN